MAGATMSTRRGTGVNTTTVTFRFYPNGTSNSALTIEGKGVTSVARNATAGEFLITFRNAYYKCIKAAAQLQLASAVGQGTQIATISNLGTSTACTALVRTPAFAGGTLTDISANANNSIFCEFVFEDSAAGV